MQLKKIKMIGFKSFVNPTEIIFNGNITGIVGPNGSGKSNIVDAIRWVLGEQSVKSLRGEGTMSDVIFSGSKSRSASSFASVILTFDNSDRYLPIDLDEVSIKRTVYKSGENEYEINNNKCRLKDITDLFTDTGASKESFNIISQGDIANILSSKPDERRVIFEDASGTLKYKKRKEESLRKLSKTNDNLVRVNDIISENETRIAPLKEAKEKAEIYLKDKKQLEENEIALIVHDIDDYNLTYQEAKKEIEVLNDKITEILSKTSTSQAFIEELKTKVNELNDKLYSKQQELVETSSNVEKLYGEKNLISERSKYDSDDIKVHDNMLLLKEELLSIENELNVLVSSKDINEKEKDQLEKELDEVIKNVTKEENNKRELLNNSNEYIRNISKLKSKKEQLENDIESNSSLPFSVRSVLANPKLIGIEGVVGKLFETDEKYVLALDAALGSTSSYIVTGNENNAKDAVNYLKANNLGRATFYPMNVIKPRNMDSESLNKLKFDDRYISLAIDLINFDSKYDNVLRNLLGTVIVTKNLDDANKASKLVNNHYKVVTLDGDIVNAGGSITGGSIKTKNSVLNIKYELEEVIKKLSETENNLSITEDKINISDETYSNLMNKRKDLLININTKDGYLNDINKKLEDLNTRKTSINNELNSNMKTVNNVISEEENEILNKYYSEKQKKENIELEIEEIIKSLGTKKDELYNYETNLKLENGDYNKLQDELKKNEITVSKLDVRLDNLLEILSTDYSLTYEKAKENYELNIPVDEARTLVTKLKREIKSLGEVNVSAIEEYKEVSERYEFLTKQRDDLLHAQDILLDIIKQMNEIMKDKFTETFKKVQIEFSNVFKKMFGGGDAELKLTEPNNILETGIDIVAMPPGKKVKHISLLSGGEKALTAISLLFAILNVRPVPFCVLDEVEAPLDEVNVDNFGRYLSVFKDKTEFVVITHKKKTMEYADYLYGVTMQESGVSKLVSVKLQDLK